MYVFVDLMFKTEILSLHGVTCPKYGLSLREVMKLTYREKNSISVKAITYFAFFRCIIDLLPQFKTNLLKQFVMSLLNLMETESS